MFRKIRGAFITATAITVLVALPGSSSAQSASESPSGHEQMHGHMESGEAVGDEEGATSCCGQMADKKKEMHAKQQEVQAELNQLVARIESSTGDTQQAAMADLLSKLVEQRGHMVGMMQMQPEMMKGMASGGMSDCPMMKNMKAGMSADEVPADDEDHSQHH